jgi:hypothetical protein
MFFDLRLLITFVSIVKLFLLPNTNYSLAEAAHQWRLCINHILNNRSKCFVVPRTYNTIGKRKKGKLQNVQHELTSLKPGVNECAPER